MGRGRLLSRRRRFGGGWRVCFEEVLIALEGMGSFALNEGGSGATNLEDAFHLFVSF